MFLLHDAVVPDVSAYLQQRSLIVLYYFPRYGVWFGQNALKEITFYIGITLKKKDPGIIPGL